MSCRGRWLATFAVVADKRAVRILRAKGSYSIVYGGLAAVIGLMVWMQLSAVIVFLGAAWNAEMERAGESALSL